MKKTALIVTTVFCLIACNEKKKDQTQIGTVRDTVLTAGVILVDKASNYYPIVTLKRMIRDTLKLTVIDSTKGKIIQESRRVLDTSYNVWWGQPVLDSLRRPMKSKVNPLIDSVQFGWFITSKESILVDYNKNWK